MHLRNPAESQVLEVSLTDGWKRVRALGDLLLSLLFLGSHLLRRVLTRGAVQVSVPERAQTRQSQVDGWRSEHSIVSSAAVYVNWLTACIHPQVSMDDGTIYYYHSVTRVSRWVAARPCGKCAAHNSTLYSALCRLFGHSQVGQTDRRCGRCPGGSHSTGERAGRRSASGTVDVPHSYHYAGVIIVLCVDLSATKRRGCASSRC